MATRIAVITGASSGIGRATAELLRGQGATVIGLSRRLEDTKTTLRCDMGNEGSVRRAIDWVLERFGRVDHLVNCAGIVTTGDPLQERIEDWEAVLRTNVIGTYLSCRYALAAMRRQRYGRIVNLSSIAGRSYSRTASIAYTCSKYAVIGLTRQLAAHLGREGITVNCVCPSQVETEMLLATVPPKQRRALGAANPLGRLAEPMEVARVIAFLLSDGASYLNGAVLDVNGGLL